jgi:hypothetical protein
MTPGEATLLGTEFHCVLEPLVISWYFGFVVSVEKPNIPWAWN